MKTRNKAIFLLAVMFITLTGFQEETEEQRIKAKAEEIRIRETAKVQELIDKDAERPKRTLLGTYELTAYEWTGNPCSNGNYPTEGYTVACNSLPLGTRIYIEGYGEYVVEDRGGMAGNVIDIYMGDYDSCIQFGRRSASIYLLE